MVMVMAVFVAVFVVIAIASAGRPMIVYAVAGSCSFRGVVLVRVTLESFAGRSVEAVGHVTSRRHTLDFASLWCIIGHCIVLRRAIVPHHDIARSPPPADSVLWPDDVSLQRANEVNRLLAGVAHESLGESTKEQSGLVSLRVNADDWMFGLVDGGDKRPHVLVPLRAEGAVVSGHIDPSVVVPIGMHGMQRISESRRSVRRSS